MRPSQGGRGQPWELFILADQSTRVHKKHLSFPMLEPGTLMPPCRKTRHRTRASGPLALPRTLAGVCRGGWVCSCGALGEDSEEAGGQVQAAQVWETHSCFEGQTTCVESQLLLFSRKALICVGGGALYPRGRAGALGAVPEGP